MCVSLRNTMWMAWSWAVDAPGASVLSTGWMNGAVLAAAKYAVPRKRTTPSQIDARA